MSPTILAIDGLSKNFGGVRAVQSVSLEIPAGRIFSVIGPNGAGKTTLINVLTGILASSGGKVTFDGEDITDAPAHLVAFSPMRFPRAPPPEWSAPSRTAASSSG